jgi:hypothetical protein
VTFVYQGLHIVLLCSFQTTAVRAVQIVSFAFRRLPNRTTCANLSRLRGLFEASNYSSTDSNYAAASLAGATAATASGIRYGSSKGGPASSAEFSVEGMPAACVIVLKPTPCATSDDAPSVMNPADGGSKAAGGPAIGVQNIPKRERHIEVSVLDRMAVARVVADSQGN